MILLIGLYGIAVVFPYNMILYYYTLVVKIQKCLAERSPFIV